MSVGLCLVTRGMICVPRRVEVTPFISCDEPLITEALEARPRIRAANTPSPALSVPRIVAGHEQKPRTKDGKVLDYQPVISDVEES